jgi:hypothetical protein
MPSLNNVHRVGELLFINTRVWYHRTDIPPQLGPEPFSISYARDFYLESDAHAAEKQEQEQERDGDDGADGSFKTNDPDSLDPRMYAAHDFDAGDVVLMEDELPDGGSIPRSLQPNCELVEAKLEGREQIVLLALVPIASREPLTIALSPDEEGEYERWELDTATGDMVRLD